MRKSRFSTLKISAPGYTLLETLVVLAVLGLAAVAVSVSVAEAIGRLEARGAAQTWQAAGAWAQLGAIWDGSPSSVGATSSALSVRHGEREACLGGMMGPVSLSTNVPRWRTATGVNVKFSEVTAAPDGGGSLYFRAPRGCYRVTIRPVSGVTTRSWLDTVQ